MKNINYKTDFTDDEILLNKQSFAIKCLLCDKNFRFKKYFTEHKCSKEDG